MKREFGKHNQRIPKNMDARTQHVTTKHTTLSGLHFFRFFILLLPSQHTAQFIKKKKKTKSL